MGVLVVLTPTYIMDVLTLISRHFFYQFEVKAQTQVSVTFSSIIKTTTKCSFGQTKFNFEGTAIEYKIS